MRTVITKEQRSFLDDRNSQFVCGSGVTLPNPAVRAGTDQGREAGRDREEEPQRGKGYRR